MHAKPLHEDFDLRIATECCVRYKDKILLQQRLNTAKSFPGFWTLPGGHIDEGEDALASVIREVKEETNIDILKLNTKLKVLAINTHIDKKQRWIIYAFISDLDVFVDTTGSDEGECKWFSVDEVLSMKSLFPPIQHYLEFILSDSKETMFMAAKLEKGEILELQSESILP